MFKLEPRSELLTWSLLEGIEGTAMGEGDKLNSISSFVLHPVVRLLGSPIKAGGQKWLRLLCVFFITWHVAVCVHLAVDSRNLGVAASRCYLPLCFVVLPIIVLPLVFLRDLWLCSSEAQLNEDYAQVIQFCQPYLPRLVFTSRVYQHLYIDPMIHWTVCENRQYVDRLGIQLLC
jgi:hypothetical protein